MIYVKLSIIIPVFNEQSNILKIRDLFHRSTIMPTELIFIDAGSTDKSRSLLYSLKADFPRINVVVKDTVRLYPGAARNLGVGLASHSIILFMDMGIDFNHDWLERMMHDFTDQKKDIIFPLCEFRGKSNFQKIVCFHSNGYKAVASVVPGLITTKNTFAKTTGFRTDVLAAEDTEWRKRISDAGFTSDTTKHPLLKYHTFPTDYSSVFRKWRSSQYNKLTALSWSPTDLLHLIVLHTLLLAAFDPMAILIYVCYRYFLLPCNRNRQIPNLKWRTRDLIAALLIPIMIDAGKLSGTWNFIIKRFWTNK